MLTLETEQEIIKPVMLKWAQDLKQTIYLEEWENAWRYNQKVLRSTPLRENYYKMFYRWHLPPTRIAKMIAEASNICWKCEDNVGTYLHQW